MGTALGVLASRAGYRVAAIAGRDRRRTEQAASRIGAEVPTLSPREGAGAHELVARRFDGVVGHAEEHELASACRLAGGEDCHLRADPARGPLGLDTFLVRDGGHAVAGTDSERTEGGPYLAGSDDGDRRSLAPHRHGPAIGSLLDLGSVGPLPGPGDGPELPGLRISDSTRSRWPAP